jgi:hypothetical protein
MQKRNSIFNVYIISSFEFPLPFIYLFIYLSIYFIVLQQKQNLKKIHTLYNIPQSYPCYQKQGIGMVGFKSDIAMSNYCLAIQPDSHF